MNRAMLLPLAVPAGGAAFAQSEGVDGPRTPQAGVPAVHVGVMKAAQEKPTRAKQ